MKAILAVVAVLLAVTHLGDTHGDHTHPHPPFLPVRLANFTYHVSEGDSTNVTVRTIGTHSFNFTVFLIIKDGGDDFDHTNITVNFPAGQDVFVTVPISTKDDDIVEALENFTLYIQVEHDAFHLGVVQLESGTIFLEDNDSGTVSFSPQNYSIPEGTVAEINIVLDKAFATDLRFEVVTTDGTATSPSDYTGGRYLVTIPALKKEGKVSVFTNKSVALEDDEYFKATLNVPQHPRLSTGLTTAVITINDRTIPVEFEQATYHVTEGSEANVTITLRTLAQRDYPFDVVVSTRSGSAGGADFQDEHYMVHFPDQAKEAGFTVTIFDDDIAECPEEFFLKLMIPPNADRMGVIKGDLSNAKVVINDTDFAEVNFKVRTYTGCEGETINLEIELDKDYSCGQKKVFCIQTTDGTATAPDDYESVNKCFPFEPNMTYSVETIDDATPEPNECFNVMIGPFPGASNVQIGANNTATVCPCDSSKVTIGFKNASHTVSEGMQARLVVALAETAERDIEFTVTTKDGTANSHGEIDYFSISTTSTIRAGTLEMSVMVRTQKNILQEPEEYFYADLSVSGDCECDNVDFGIKTAKITIVDLTVLVSLRNDSNEEVIYEVKEGVNHACVTLEADGPIIQTAFNVTVIAKNDTATHPSDYAAKEVTATFLPGETTANACIPIVDDDVHECLEWFTLQLNLTQAAVDLCAVLSSPYTAHVRIEDNDDLSLYFDPATYNIIEGDLAELSFFLNRTSQTDIPFTAMTMNGTADKLDYVGGNFPATIHAGRLNVTLPLLTKADVLLESTEFLQVIINPNETSQDCSAVVPGPPANVFIIDGTVPVKFSASVYHVCTVLEKRRQFSITLEAMMDHKFDFTVKVHTKDGTAKRNSDYDAEPVITKRFSVQQRIVTISISINPGGDMVEPPENFTVELEIPEEAKNKGVVAVEPSTAEIVITDVPIGRFSQQKYTVREGDVADLMIVLDRSSGQDTIFNVATMNDTATTFDDYFRYNRNVTVPAGAMGAFTTVVTQRNAKIEPEEYFKAIVRPLVKCDLDDGVHNTSILITDCTILVKFSSAMYTVTEGMDTKVTITVLANGAVDESDFGVHVIAKDGTATRGVDYVFNDTLLSFKRGEIQRNFTINITDDLLAEPIEIFTLELARPQQGSTVCIARGSPDIAHVRVADDDVVTVSFSPQNYTVSEGIPATLGMVLDKEASESITVFVTTTDITAGSADYVQENGTPVTFAPGKREDELQLLTLRDTVINEPDEYLKATLELEPTTIRVEIGPDPCFVTITDATIGVKFLSDELTVKEGDGSVTVTVEASKDHADFSFKIKVVAQDGTAEVMSDLNDQVVEVIFPAGQTTVDATIGINDDDIAECPETFYLVLEIPERATSNGVVAISPNTSEITIIDNDGVNITFHAPTNRTVREGKGIDLVLEVQGKSAKNISVTVTFTSITAQSNDYRVTSNMVTIPAHENTTNVTLEALWDTECEGTETLRADLSLTQLPTVNVTILPVTAYIEIEDATVPVQFQETSLTVEEGVNLTVTLTALAPHDYGFVVNVTIMDGTAERGSDYNATEVIQVPFPANQSTVDFSIHIIDNDLAECPKQFQLVLEVPENATDMGVVTKQDNTAVVNIKDTWDVVNISFSQMTYTVPESEEVMLKISLDKASSEDITLRITTMDITAQSSIDYEEKSIDIIIPAGMNESNVTILTKENTNQKNNTEFKVILSLPGNCGSARLVENMASVTICDTKNVIRMQFKEDHYPVGEGMDLNAVIGVVGEGWHPGESFSVNVCTKDDTAKNGMDYSKLNFTVDYPDGPCTYYYNVSILNDDIGEFRENFTLEVKIPPEAAAVCVFKGSPATATIEIIDYVVVTITSVSEVKEGTHSHAVITLDVARDCNEDSFNLTLVTKNGSATPGSDYNETRIPVMIKPGDREVTVRVPIVDDYFLEEPEEFTVKLDIPPESAALNVISGSPGTVPVKIADNDVSTPIHVRFSEDKYYVAEGKTSVTITLEALDNHTVSFTVTVSTRDGTASSSTDYSQRSRTSVRFPARVNQVTFTVPIRDERRIESNETFYIDLEIPLSAAKLGVIKDSPSTVCVTIVNDDVPIPVSFNQTTYSVLERKKSVSITLVAAADHTFPFSVYVSTRDGTASSSSDYSSLRRRSVHFPARVNQVTFTVTIRDEGLIEPNEQFYIDLDIPSSAANLNVVEGKITTATVTIVHDDEAIVVMFNQPSYSVDEGEKSVSITLVAEDHDFPFSVTVSTRDGTASSRSDYTWLRRSLYFPARVNQVTFTVAIRDEGLVELNEEFYIELEIPSSAANHGVVTDFPANATVNIRDDDVAIPVRFNQTTYRVVEGERSVSITVVAAADHAFSFSVTVSTQDGTASSRSDYTWLRRSVYFPARVNQVTFTVAIRDERLIEPNEEFYIDLEIPSAAANRGVVKELPDNATVNIRDDDVPVPVRFSQATYLVNEGERSVSITLEALASHTCSFSVIVSTRDGTASSSTDYSKLSRKSVYFRAEVNEVSFTVTIRDEGLVENEEEFYIELDIPPTAAASCSVVKASPDNATVIIRDDDVPVPVRFNQTTYSVVEGKRSVSITLEALASHTCSFSVIVSTRDGTASSTTDYSKLTRKSVYFRAGVNAVPFTVTIRDEGLVELDEEFYIELEIPLSAATSCSVINDSPDNATVIIQDDDAVNAVPVRFNQTTYSVVEGKKSVSITLVAADHTFSFSVTVYTRDGTASSPSDYSSLRRRSVSFRAGVNEVSFTVTINDNRLVEQTEEFYIELEIPSAAANRGVVKNSPDNATVFIQDDDVAIPVRFNQTTYSVVEGERSVSITLVAAADHDFPFSVTVSTRDGTASSPSDYTRKSHSSVYFRAGVNQVTFTVTIRDEGLIESNETFYIELEIPSAAASSSVVKGSPGNATVIIQDDDASKAVPVKFSQTIYRVTEKAKDATITLQALANHTFSFTITVSTRDGTATSDDYGRFSRLVRFPARVNEVSFNVPIYDDKRVEITEEFYIDLEIPSSSAYNSVIKDPDSLATTTVTITDGSNGVRFIASTYKGTEGVNNSILVTVVAEPITNCLRSFTVYVTSRDGSATSDVDYSAPRIPVTFDIEETVKSFTVNIINDSLCENTENFFLDLEIPPEAVLEGVFKGSPTSTKIEIVNNENCVIPVKFGSPTYTVGEKQRSLSGTLETPAYYRRSFTVYVVPHNRSANATGGTDYRSARIRVTFSSARHVIPFTVTLYNDFILEFDEYFFLDLEIPAAAAEYGVIRASPDRAIVHIKDDERDVPVKFSSSNYTVGENRRLFTGTLKTPGHHARAFTVYVVTNDTNATATDGIDYRRARIPLTFSAGRKEHTFTVIIHDDIIFESDEYFFLDLEIPAEAAAYGVSKVSPDRAKVYIEDDEYEIPVRFRNATYEVTEGVRVKYVPITLEVFEDRTFSFKVRVSTRDGSAEADEDYRTLDTDITISPRHNSYTFNVQIRPDEELEFPEDFYIDLSIAPEAESRGVRLVSPDSARVVIKDDDMVLLTLDPDTVVLEEDEGTVNLTITVSKPVEFPYNVTINTRNGTAKANVDFKPGPYVVTFESGKTTATVSVNITDDEAFEDDEIFHCFLTISEELVSNGFVVDPSAANTTITIRDNDELEVEFEIDTVLAVESDDDPEDINVLARGLLGTSITINIIANVAGGGANVSDFDTAKSVRFNAGETEASFPFLASCDTEEEGNEVVRLELQVPERYRQRISIIGNDHIEVVIIDNCYPNPGQLREINDTVFHANPVYTVPILNFTEGSSINCDTTGYPICYEVHGQSDAFFNLISDNCVSVNAHYVAAENPLNNVIKAIGVVATDKANRCHYVNVSVTENGTCEATVDGEKLVNNSSDITGIVVKHRNKLVRIDAPNCGQRSHHLVMWVHCQRLMVLDLPQAMIKFNINRGLCQRTSAHGLIGQFWGVPFKLGPIIEGNSTITMYPPGGARNRTMLAQVYESTWTQNGVPAIPRSRCLYVGSQQGGAWPSNFDPVINGTWQDYRTDSLFDTDWTYSRYKEQTCGTD